MGGAGMVFVTFRGVNWQLVTLLLGVLTTERHAHTDDHAPLTFKMTHGSSNLSQLEYCLRVRYLLGGPKNLSPYIAKVCFSH